MRVVVCDGLLCVYEFLMCMYDDYVSVCDYRVLLYAFSMCTYDVSVGRAR